MQKLLKMPDFVDICPPSERPLRVAAYCRVSTHQGSQDGSIEQQEQYYTQVISRNTN